MTSIIKVDTIQDSSGGSAINMGAGSIVQIQTFQAFTNSSTHISTNSGTAAQLGDGTSYDNAQVTITPKFSNSKILVEIFSTMVFYNAGIALVWELYRDSTAIVSRSTDYAVPNYYGLAYHYDNNSSHYGSHSARHIDTPNTTSAITYKWYHSIGYGTGTCYSVHGGGQYSMTATEIKV